ncbi:vinorine synthase-like [Prunus avium]|uniref:Vinorine synthase-like n=1 Tax=Prunus avium TaxID=42229 RepID=A0A6P5U118_PRUAV|nr:vinorine synthase-like [Prunus avium]
MPTLEIEVLSTETIKPSSPTPPHLRRHNLSFIDQLNPPVFMPMVLFFPKDPDATDSTYIQQRCTRIKLALSETLTKFYPLAGRVRENQYIDCNDEGALYVEAKASVTIADVITNPNPNDFNKFLPCELDSAHELGVCLQITSFVCGGMSIAMGMSHKAGDALAYFSFLNSLAAATRGEVDALPAPDFVSDKYFPQMDLSGFYHPTNGMVKDNISTKRFVFEAPAISTLRVKCTDAQNEHARRPTRVEALSAFILSRYAASCNNPKQIDNSDDVPKRYIVSHAVNLRTRMDPPLPEYTFGNLSRMSQASPAVPVGPKDGSVSDSTLQAIVGHVREGLKQVNTEYVKKLKDGHQHLSLLKERISQVKRGELVPFSFTSLCRFPMYDADFGWGKAVYMGSASLTYRNLVSFFDTPSGDGVEAWVNLRKEDMEIFEADEEFLKYVSPNHSWKKSGVKTLIY